MSSTTTGHNMYIYILDHTEYFDERNLSRKLRLPLLLFVCTVFVIHFCHQMCLTYFVHFEMIQRLSANLCEFLVVFLGLKFPLRVLGSQVFFFEQNAY